MDDAVALPDNRFGLFIAPFHPLDGDPTLQLRRDLELAVLADELGFDEVWFGEHHSAGFETIGSPELMIAAAGERTSRIMLGTGVNSVSYHNPLILADRIVQLDHLTRGRVMMGIGPGQLPSDAFMLGIDPLRQRDMMAEAVEALLPLLRGEKVTKQTEWFDLREAAVQLLPYGGRDIEVAIASVYSPTGVTLAGRHGLSVLSVAASDLRARGRLAGNWAVHEQVSADHGRTARRGRWRVVGMMHLAESREQARREVEWGVLGSTAYFEGLTGEKMPWRSSPGTAVDQWTTEGLPSWGVGIVGTPDDAIAAIESLQRETGGFGTYLLNVHSCAPWHATKRSYELFAEYVIPHFRQANRNREASIAWAGDNSQRFVGRMTQAIEQATQKYGA
ncbi:LLM class flavin-dependent oxidoreductase [Amycolatopsis circi]|uniref:LLM class flavin-dependent oxidoreductase n=1 Tax=Amycolatopsis circi TaxID=871959 RepID=UPI000E276EB3|nr:LLM class flavin-dependent oxidoreductase [Amycolatopsis circi]